MIQISPPSPNPTVTPFERMGGETTVRALVNRFYDLMDTDPEVKIIRDLHGADLIQIREVFYEFLTGWLGGPALYINKYGHPRLRRRHMPFSIGEAERDQWLRCMFQAMKDIQLDDALQTELQQSFFKTADFMRNREEAS
jgi:hemoglobin